MSFNLSLLLLCFFFFQAEDGIRDYKVTGVQTCALPICDRHRAAAGHGVQDRRGLCGNRDPRVRADPVRLARESQLARGRRADAHGTQALDNSSGAKPRRKSPARIARMIASRSRGASTSIHARPKWM